MIRTVRNIALVMALGVSALGVSAPAWADSVSGATQDGYARLSFSIPATTKISATTTGGVLAISFSAKTDIDPAAITAALPRVIASGRADEDGKTLRFTLAQPVKLHVSQIGARAVVDVAPMSFTGTMPDLVAPPKPAPKPLDMASLPEIKMRTGSYEKFTRLVFDWPRNVSYQVYPGAGKMSIRFAAQARMDVSVIARFAPAWVKNAAWRLDGQSTLVEFDTDSDSGYHHFRDGNKIVLDVLAPKTDVAAYAPPGTAKPVATKMDATKMAAAPATATVSKAQAQAIAQTAAQLAPKKPEPKAADAKPDPHAKPDAKAAETKAADATPDAAKVAEAATPVPGVPVADGKRTRDGALITFKGAGGHAAAVFVRGLTAWIVLENAPNFESRNLKTALGDFAQRLDAVSSNGLGILRITLKTPAQIGARGTGSDLEVEIAPQVAPAPVTIGFARNQSDPKRASLSTLLPAADRAFQILDPNGGDMLTIVPTAPGRGMPNARFFADFATLPTASGLVITPYVDDLKVDVAMARVTISRPSGMALTPPQMPVGQSPSALARFGDGPSYLDFAKWGAVSGGSFLAAERQLTQAIAKEPSAQAGIARIELARFYLANGFAAEALGVIRLVESNDPALTGDVQLTTMRAASAYMMGRYRDAHNELNSPGFDSDRHAAFWRGLIDTSMENWKSAHTRLQQAAPVLARYPAFWQTTAHLADAEAALGLGRLDLADAALSRLPKDLEPRHALMAQLLQARLAAAQNKYRDATAGFAHVEKSGDEKLAAQAIFHHTTAALSARALTVPQGIEKLERLRFRWRGDQLEMKTLRKLASLYFERGQNREGLKTLRVAVQNFSGQESARVAQDDMRAAFTKLYLKGDADKMKPVDSLALFYDNIDLTPIGPDGDDMIRRMSDRLVAVDLLGPAASLLAYQVEKRLDGIAKAQVATRLAGVYLMDHKPQLAINAIRGSQITGLPQDEMQQRMLLEARAFAALKQWDNALDLIAVDESEDSRRLRADIYWESGNWAVAGQKAEEFLAPRRADAAPLSPADRAYLLRAATAYSLANDQTGLDRLRTDFAARMKPTPDANLFAVLSASIAAQGLAFREAAAKIAAIDTLKSFMQDFAKRNSDVKS